MILSCGVKSGVMKNFLISSECFQVLRLVYDGCLLFVFHFQHQLPRSFCFLPSLAAIVTSTVTPGILGKWTSSVDVVLFPFSAFRSFRLRNILDFYVEAPFFFIFSSTCLLPTAAAIMSWDNWFSGLILLSTFVVTQQSFHLL